MCVRICIVYEVYTCCINYLAMKQFYSRVLKLTFGHYLLHNSQYGNKDINFNGCYTTLKSHKNI